LLNIERGEHDTNEDDTIILSDDEATIDLLHICTDTFFVVVMSPTLFCGCNDTDIFCGYDDTDTLCGCSETRFYINICLCVFSSDPQTYFFLKQNDMLFKKMEGL
jgi:hypothetical protein